MGLNAPALFAALQVARVTGAHPLLGPQYDRLALGIAEAVSDWGSLKPFNLAVAGRATGVAGVGMVSSVTSRLIVPPMPPLVQSCLIGAGVAGVLAPSLATAVAVGVATGFSLSARYSGASAGVGVGAEWSKIVVADPMTLRSTLMSTLSSVLGAGPALPQLATGLANGIAAMILTGGGKAAVVGTPTVPPVPATGFTACTVV